MLFAAVDTVLVGRNLGGIYPFSVNRVELQNRRIRGDQSVLLMVLIARDRSGAKGARARQRPLTP